jgi:aryl carrier-like protein
MDEKLQLVPVGVKGEICVAGTGVGRGYVKQPALTAQKFADDPFHAGEKMYCTGDMGRWLPDGNIEFHGRKDNQVKLRGFRIELGEIENLMYQFDGVTAAAVLVKTDAAGDEQLVSYVVTEQPAKINGLTAWLKAKLPPYMVPGFNIVLDKMPFTSSDKIDRKALPSPWDKDASAIKVYTGPENEVQRQLVRIWQEILGHEPIGIHDNFFENGGHSIKAMRMLAEVSKEMNVVIELNTVFRHPTIAALSAIIPSITPVKFQPIARVGLLPDYPLSYAQARLWIMDKFEKDHISFNMPQMYGFEGEFNRPAFEKAMNALVERHESLRTIFPLVNGEPRQKIIPAAESRFHFTYTDLREIPDNESLVASEGAAEASTPFDLSEGPLVRARLLQLRDDKYVLLFTVHHIIFDGWSAGVLTKDFLILYHAFCKGNENPLLPLRIQYKDYTAWQQEQLTGELLHAHEQYWLDRLSGTIPELDISADKERPSVKTYNGNRIIISLSAQQSEQLRTLGREQGTSLFITMVAIFKYLLHRYSGQQDIIVGTTVANRDHPDLADQIGFFINTLPLRTQFSGTETFLEFLALVNNNILRAYAHRDYPFDLLVKKLNIPRDAARSPVFDVQVEQVSIEDKNEPEDEMEGASVSFKDESLLLTKYDLSFRFLDTTNGIIINLEYNTDLFYDKSIAAMGNRLQELINSILENPAITLDAEIQTGNVADKSTGNEQFSNVFNTSDIL